MGQRSSIAWLGCVVSMGLSLAGCVGTVNVGGGPEPEPNPTPSVKTNKLDLLLVVDNSRSMADKQELLARSMADFVQAAQNPPCVDANGQIGQTPANPQDPCPAGQTRQHAPITDMHVGVISTSIGGHGADSCPAVDTNSCAPNINTTNDDKGHLLSRSDPCGSSAPIPTYQSQGFLAWDLNSVLSPPGVSDAVQLASTMAEMVIGAGQVGCGYESQLESWYRFLADPEPYESISVVNNIAVPSGIDSDLLTQRANFLRPDSLLVILQLSDENDCSIMETGQFYVAGQLRLDGGTPFRMPRPRSECAIDPNDPCCKSCGSDPGDCPVDPTCSDGNGGIARLTEEEDNINLRCFDQKRRFGIDFLYPVDRYTQALTQTMIANRAGALVPNPIFAEYTTADGQTTRRSPELVYYANITGVPWQEIARNPSDLSQGFKSAAELAQGGAWDALFSSPYMAESIAPRAGVTPGNAYNGGDRTITTVDDLQYSCVFALESPRNCADQQIVACDCFDKNNDSPICAPNPDDSGLPTLQVAAKAFPSPRTMRVVQSLGDQGILSSICPAQINDAAAGDYAYRPVVRGLLERVGGHME